MRLQFTDWKMEGGVTTERRATCGPLRYCLHKHGNYLFARCGGPTADAIRDSDGESASFDGFPAAESACEAHLQAILVAAAAMDAGRTTNA